MVLFHRRFGEVTISVKTLFNLYKKNGIKRKAFRLVKTMRFQETEERRMLLEAIIHQVRQAISSCKIFIFSDEAVFTTAI